jgi:hypothetical protein
MMRAIGSPNASFTFDSSTRFSARGSSSPELPMRVSPRTARFM